MGQDMEAEAWQLSLSVRVRRRPSGVSALELFFKGLVVVAPKQGAGCEVVRHAVGTYGVALDVVNQKAFESLAGVEEA